MGKSMIIKVYDYEDQEKGTILEFKARKNAKSILDLVKKELQKKYNCSIRNSMVQGKIDYADPTKTELHYILWGENLPCRIINYVSCIE